MAQPPATPPARRPEPGTTPPWRPGWQRAAAVPVPPAAPPVAAASFLIAEAGREVGPVGLRDLAALAVSGGIRAETMLRRDGEAGWFPAREVPGLFSHREWLVALVLSVSLGVFGVDRFYLGQLWLGAAKLLTVGGFGLWWAVDVVLLLARQTRDVDRRPLR